MYLANLSHLLAQIFNVQKIFLLRIQSYDPQYLWVVYACNFPER